MRWIILTSLHLCGMCALLAAVPAVLAAPETDIPYMGSGTVTVGDHALRLDGSRLLTGAGEVLVDRLYTPPVGDGAWLCAADDNTDGLGRLRCWDGQLRAVTLATGGRPGRLAIQPGGQAGGTVMVAWVASPRGLPQVFTGSADGRIAPRALTNADLRYTPGQAPEGFVPPPLGQTLRFDGDWLRWEAPDGPRAVMWR